MSIAEVARAAGLTHGAFDGRFTSKTALVAEAIETSLTAAARRWRARAARRRAAGGEALASLNGTYLSAAHRDGPETGCALAALDPELSRAEPLLAAALHAGTAALVAVLADEIGVLHPTLAPPARYARALAVLSAMTGGLVMARVLAADGAASRAVLDTAATLARAAADLPSIHG